MEVAHVLRLSATRADGERVYFDRWTMRDVGMSVAVVALDAATTSFAAWRMECSCGWRADVRKASELAVPAGLHLIAAGL